MPLARRLSAAGAVAALVRSSLIHPLFALALNGSIARIEIKSSCGEASDGPGRNKKGTALTVPLLCDRNGLFVFFFFSATTDNFDLGRLFQQQFLFQLFFFFFFQALMYDLGDQFLGIG
jgi:hypothetical protein